MTISNQVMAALLLPVLLGLSAPATAAERRCGWLENPTPANNVLRDRDGEWVITEQGGYRAKGADDLPDMTTAGWVETNMHYGYGCACMTVDTDAKRKRITRVLQARPVPLGQCRGDRSLPKPLGRDD